MSVLSDRQRRELASIATRVNVPSCGTVYREHSTAAAVYICGHGALKAFRDFPDGTRRVVAFVVRDDKLTAAGVIQFKTPHLVRIRDRRRFEQMTAYG